METTWKDSGFANDGSSLTPLKPREVMQMNAAWLGHEVSHQYLYAEGLLCVDERGEYQTQNTILDRRRKGAEKSWTPWKTLTNIQSSLWE